LLASAPRGAAKASCVFLFSFAFFHTQYTIRSARVYTKIKYIYIRLGAKHSRAGRDWQVNKISHFSDLDLVPRCISQHIYMMRICMKKNNWFRFQWHAVGSLHSANGKGRCEESALLSRSGGALTPLLLEICIKETVL